jgi:hypothetical protein
MRKNRDNKKRWTVILVAGFIVFSMVISIFAIVLDNQSGGTPNYNKNSFVATDYGFKTKIDGKYMDFYYHPIELERIVMDENTAKLFRESSGVAFIFNPNDNASNNLQYVDAFRFDLRLQMRENPIFFGITQESDKYDLPIIDCLNATINFPFVLMNFSSETGFYPSEDNPYCIILNGKFMELMAAKDRFVYTYYGVMN